MTSGLKRRTARRVGGLAVAVMALGPVAISAAPAAEAYTPSPAVVAAYEARVIWRINVERAKYKRVRLVASYCPDRYAENWAAYLARSGRFYHQGLYPMLRTCSATVAAENLARGNVSADRMVYAWMNSYGHRKNILDGRLNRIGVAAVYARGQWVVAANFTRS